MRVLIATLMVMTVAATLGPSSLAAQTVCPVENQRTRGAVVKFLTLESTLPTRQADGLAGVSHLRLRLLTDAADSAVCRTLRDGIRLRRSPTPWQWAFYYADGFYFVATVRDQPPGMIMLGHSPLIVLRSDLSLVDSYAN